MLVQILRRNVDVAVIANRHAIINTDAREGVFISQRRKTCILQQRCEIKDFCFSSREAKSKPVTGQRTNAADLDDRLLLACICNSVRDIHKVRSSFLRKITI